MNVAQTEDAMLEMINNSLKLLPGSVLSSYVGSDKGGGGGSSTPFTRTKLDDKFYKKLCEKLYISHNKEVLLRMQNTFVMRYLECNDEDLLYRWYNIHGYHEDAQKLMFRIATAPGTGVGVANQPFVVGKIDIGKRIEYLQKAWRSASVANTTAKYDYQAALRVAEAWSCILHSFQALRTQIEDIHIIHQNMRSNNNNNTYKNYCDYTHFLCELDGSGGSDGLLKRIEYEFISDDSPTSMAAGSSAPSAIVAPQVRKK